MKTITIQPERVFRALSDGTRLRILHLLLSGEVCVCHLVDVIRCPQPKASRHLAYLRRVGLVRVRKEGVWCYYRLAPAATDFDLLIHQCIEQCGELPKLEKDAQRLKALSASCCE